MAKTKKKETARDTFHQPMKDVETWQQKPATAV